MARGGITESEAMLLETAIAQVTKSLVKRFHAAYPDVWMENIGE